MHAAYLGVFLLGAALLSFTGGNPAGMLGSFAVLAVAAAQITRVLFRPAGTPDTLVLPEHDHAAALRNGDKTSSPLLPVSWLALWQCTTSSRASFVTGRQRPWTRSFTPLCSWAVRIAICAADTPAPEP
jgi:hypothetical protein